VEECTNDEIGVGALIAANNQELNGNWALFTLAPSTKANNPQITILCCLINILTTPNINITKNKSPTRF
jgi:hypothetical protein